MKDTKEMLNTLNVIQNVIRILYESDTFNDYFRFHENENDFNSFVEKHFEYIKKLILSVEDY